jgi:DNA-binding NtrC family response regulator
MVRETLVEQLQDLGYKVIETVSADQALSALDTPGLRIDAVVSDNAMPGSMTGVELLTLVRQRFPTIPALLVSGRMDRPVSEVTGIGARFMAKPYERDDLARVLREMLAARRQLVS